MLYANLGAEVFLSETGLPKDLFSCAISLVENKPLEMIVALRIGHYNELFHKHWMGIE